MSTGLVIPSPATAPSILLPRRHNPWDDLRRAARYKVYYGGRGAAKSWSIARALILFADRWCLRILCAREVQASIADSVHRLLVDQIHALGLEDRYQVTDKSIRNRVTGSRFIFKGLKNARGLKSLEAVDICWVEEAETVTDESWEILIPTIRKERSEIWISFNTRDEADSTYQRFVVHSPPDAIVHKVSWRDNPFFPATLDKERRNLLERDPDAYDHIWEGMPRKFSEAVIFRKRTVIETFETPRDVRFYHGADWGFAADPTALVRSWKHEQDLMIDAEAFGHGVELDEIPQLFDSIDTSRRWPIKADSARPETISHVKKAGFNISAAKKWPGSVEDGITHLLAYRRIVIHRRCEHMQQEARLYSYKVDKVTKDVLPIIVDKHNHGWDATRYSLDGEIRGKQSFWG